MVPVLVVEDPGHDGVLALGEGAEDQVSSLGGEEVLHGFSYPSSCGGEPLFKVLPPEIPSSGAFGSENLPVSDTEFGPVIVVLMGIEGVSSGSSSAPMVISEWVKLMVLDESLSVGDKVHDRRV